MLGGEFLAKIRLVLEGKEKVVQGLQETQMSAEKMAGTQISFPWMEKVYPTIQKGVGATKEFKKSFDELGKSTSKSTNQMGDFERALRRAMIVAPVWMAFRAVMMGTLRLISEQVTFLKDLETAMARIRIVGKGTEEQYNNLRSSLVALSVSYGTVASAATQAAVIFAQQGKSIEEVTKLTQVSMLASQVLGADMTATVNNLTAAINAFNIPAESAVRIVDKLINVEKNYAVTSANLADAIKVVGATAHQMGISIDALLGDVTAVIEVTRKSGAEAARGLQFIYARMLTTGKDVIQQIAKVPIHLDNQNKATFALTNTYRTATSVLDDLATKWDSLTNKEKLSIAQNVASKRQLTVFMALMQNYNASLNARITALSAAGKAEEAFAIIQDTLAFKLNQLSASWNNLTTSIGDTGAFKDAINAITELINRWAAIINISQAYRNEATKIKDENERIIDTQISQAQSIAELIKLRNQYLNAPPTDKNKEMLSKIETALNNLMKVSKIKIDIDAKDAIDNLKKTEEVLKKEKIQQSVDIDIATSRAILEEKIKRLLDTLKPSGFIIKDIIDQFSLRRNREQLKTLEKELQGLDKKRNDLIEERLLKQEVELTNAEAKKAWMDDELNLSGELTDAEIEKLDIQSKLNKAKILGVLNSAQLVDLEIKLVAKADLVYGKHEMNLKLAELRKQKEEEILKSMVAQNESIRNQYINYEKADMFERGRLRRLMELQKLTPEELGVIFEKDMYDKNIITQYWSSFSKEGQDSINDVIQRLYNLPEIDLGAMLGKTNLLAPPFEVPSISQQIIGVNTINLEVSVANLPTSEEMARVIGKIVEEKCSKDDSFVQAFTNKIRPIL